MIYKNSEIPSNFDKIAEIGDNYVVWVKNTILNSGSEYDAYIQFFNPSFYYYYTDSYRIKNGDFYEIYNNAPDGSSPYNTINFFLHSQSVNSEYISTSDSARLDYITIFAGQLLTVVCILWVFKQLSRLFFKGGLS